MNTSSPDDDAASAGDDVAHRLLDPAGSGSAGSGSGGDERVEERAAELLPEERAAGSTDPEAQAEAILAESDEREAGLAPVREHRTSGQTATPGDATR